MLEEEPRQDHSGVLVELVQKTFRTGTIPTEGTWASMVLLPKPDGGVHGISLLEAYWTLVSTIIGKSY